MTAAVSLGSSMQAISAGAAAAAQQLPTVVAGGAQALGTTAATAAVSAPQAVSTGAATTAKLATDLAVVDRPVKAMAAGLQSSTILQRTAGFLSKALPVVTIGASTLAGGAIVDKHGAEALLTTKQGRGAVLGALGGTLLLLPHPATQLAAAGVLGLTAVNHFDGFRRFDDPTLGATPAPEAVAGTPANAAAVASVASVAKAP